MAGSGTQQPGYGGQGGSSGSTGKAAEAEAVVQKFYDKIMADDTKDMGELFSAKAAGKAKAFRDGKAGEEMVSEMKTAMTNLRISSNKQVQGTHLVLMEENGGGNSGMQSSAASGRGERGQRKIGKKVQFQVVSEGGKFVIKDIRAMDH
jgi:hypothetical protein